MHMQSKPRGSQAASLGNTAKPVGAGLPAMQAPRYVPHRSDVIAGKPDSHRAQAYFCILTGLDQRPPHKSMKVPVA